MMFKKGLMILLVLSFAFSMENDECPVCQKSKNIKIPYPCMHKMCNTCTNLILNFNNSICLLCKTSIKKTSDLETYEKELESLTAAVMNKSITVEKIISHYYFLPPWQCADEQMLTDIQKIQKLYPTEEIYKLFDILQNVGFNYTIEEDMKHRRMFFREKPNNTEKIILQSYYDRNHYDAEKELELRKNVFKELSMTTCALVP
ncbi:uncharacterized protein LOC126897404 [Daktulosphaira vitifoliae]|uniref:uncharacterized protein LOC126897404 n=1 Tax=Daktulosphaira vitifoliae TaxID=58002 RepID=UPI0021AB0A81|nr:uncharacterized protein LOC126897404 [Daktulosphaira vitifoliae]